MTGQRDPHPRVHDEKAAGMLVDRLRLMFDWYKGMVDECGGRFLYLYDPENDVAVVAFDFDERDPGMLEMLKLAIEGAKRNGRHVGICGEAPANYPEIARYLAGLGIDSISVNPSSLLRTMDVVAEAEAAAGRRNASSSAAE
jgi:signal transduction protein with GAF and PtsI domain